MSNLDIECGATKRLFNDKKSVRQFLKYRVLQNLRRANAGGVGVMEQGE